MAKPLCVVVDNGSSEIRAGYSGEAAPRVCVPSVVGLPRNKGVAMAAGFPEYEVGYDALEQRGMLQCVHPIVGSNVASWDDLERLWAHLIFKELRITPEQHCFVMSGPANSSTKYKERTLEIVMDTFNAHSMYLGAAPVFCLYAYGRTTGLVVDAGVHNTAAIPVHEGYPLGRHISTSPVAGDALTDYLCRLLQAKGFGFSTAIEKELVNDAKESLCYVKSQTDDSREPQSFCLPDGQEIVLDEERTECAEVLFDFSKLGESFVPKDKVFADAGHEFQPSFAKGVSWLAYSAINKCEPSLRPTLYNNIVLAGGSSLFRGTPERIHREVVQLYKEMHPNEGLIPIDVTAVACRQHSAWLGASMLSQVTMFPALTVTRQEYHEQGPRVIRCKSL